MHLDKQEAALRQLLAEAVGCRIRVASNAVKTGAGEDFTALSWHHVPQTIEEVRARRAALASGTL